MKVLHADEASRRERERDRDDDDDEGPPLVNLSIQLPCTQRNKRTYGWEIIITSYLRSKEIVSVIIMIKCRMQSSHNICDQKRSFLLIIFVIKGKVSCIRNFSFKSYLEYEDKVS